MSDGSDDRIVLDYRGSSPDRPLTFQWVENESGVEVILPPPPMGRLPLGCAAAFVVGAVIFAIAVLIIAIVSIVQQGTQGILMSGVLLVFAVYVLYWSVSTLNQSRKQTESDEPGVILISNSVVKVRRAGLNRDMDYSWELNEIADIRLCPSSPQRVIGAVPAVINSLSREQFMRVSVESTDSRIDDILVATVGTAWIEELETKLRSYLKLR